MDHGLASQDDEMKLSGTPGAPPPPEEDLMNDIAPVKSLGFGLLGLRHWSFCSA